MTMRENLRRTRSATHPRLPRLAREEGGFTIVEVVVSSVILVLIAGGVLTGIDAATRSSADLRYRTQAQELAQQDQERMRGMSAQQLSGLNETRPVTVDDTEFTVTSTGQFLSHADGGTSCGGSSADYVRVVSTVDWTRNRRPPVVVQSIVTPPLGGTMLVRVRDQADLGVPAAAVTVEGPENHSGTTGTDGCIVFTGMEVGDYVVTASASGYVNWDGETEVTDDAHVSTSETSIPVLEPLGRAGAILANFNTRIDGTSCATPPNYCTSQRAPSLSWSNAGAFDGASQTRNADVANGSATIRTPATGFNLFPFAVGGVTTNNWTIWGGRCDLARPPTNDRSFATVNPGAEASGTAARVRLPAMIVNVTFIDAAGTATRVTPRRIHLTDACGQGWRPSVRPGAPLDLRGQLNFPGQPYAPTANPYQVCADYRVNTSSPIYRATVSSANDNFTAGTLVGGTQAGVVIDSRIPGSQAACP